VPTGPSTVRNGPWLRLCAELARQRAELPATRLIIELGRYLVASAGYYLTAVRGGQTKDGRPAVVVDGGVHQRPDLCGLDLSHRADAPFTLVARPGPEARTDVLGCLWPARGTCWPRRPCCRH